MARYLLKASDEEMDRWRGLVPAGGSLAAWIRAALNAECGVGDGPSYEARYGGELRAVEAVFNPRPFRPDFRGGKP